MGDNEGEKRRKGNEELWPVMNKNVALWKDNSWDCQSSNLHGNSKEHVKLSILAWE